MRQRYTLFNPGQSNDDIVTFVDKTKLELVTKDGFLLEKKLTFDNDKSKYNLIKKVRITSIDEIINNPIFNYHYLPGLNIYISPNLSNAEFDKQEFFNQIDKFLDDLNVNITIDESNYIQTLNSLYYYQSNHLVTSLKWDSWTNNDDNSKIIDFLWQLDKTVIKLLEKVADNTSITWKIDENYQEIGLFMIDQDISSRDDIVLSGLRVIFDPEDEDEENVFKTLFHVKPRHRSIGKSLQLIKSNGLHPIVKSFLTSPLPEDEDLTECRLYYYASLDKSVFFDKYQDYLGVLVINNGEQDLELPEYKINKWGQEVMFEFPVDFNKTVDLTLHARYQKPNEINNRTVITLTKPLLFYGCEVTDSHLLNTSPFDNKNVIGGNYEAYFTDDTVFYHVENEHGSKFHIDIPNGSSTFEKINTITVISIFAGIVLILFKLLQVFNKRLAPITPRKKRE